MLKRAHFASAFCRARGNWTGKAKGSARFPLKISLSKNPAVKPRRESCKMNLFEKADIKISRHGELLEKHARREGYEIVIWQLKFPSTFDLIETLNFLLSSFSSFSSCTARSECCCCCRRFSVGRSQSESLPNHFGTAELCSAISLCPRPQLLDCDNRFRKSHRDE